jgi:hypothetical protein
MSHTTRPADTPAGQPQSRMQNVQPTEMSGWVGWIAFAGVMMLLVGSFHIIQGLVAVFENEYFLVSTSGLAVSMDFTAWGCTHIIGGIVLVLAGIAVFSGQIWARTVGVILAVLSALVNIAFLAAYPIWSVTMIAVDILVIWALTVHGAELKQ